MAFCRDIPSHEKNPDPENKKSRIPGMNIPGIFHKSLGFLLGIFGLFHLAQNKKIPIPKPRDQDSGSRKNPVPKPTLVIANRPD